MFESLVRVEEDGDYWRLVRPLAYAGNRDRWVIPVGFRTDFASTPRWAQPLLSRTGKHNRAAVAHDYLCRVAVHLIPSTTDPADVTDDLPMWLSRLDADRIFLRMLRELDVPEWQAKAMYLGVRVGYYMKGF